MIRCSPRLAVLAVVASLVMLAGCKTTPTIEPVADPVTPVAVPKTEPVVRVRIAIAADTLRVDATAPVQVYSMAADGTARGEPAMTLTPPVIVTRSAEGFRLQPSRGVAQRWAVERLVLRDQNGGNLTTASGVYPVQLTLLGVGPVNRFDVVNRLSLEQYLPGVLERELYRAWEPETYKAQAIAARSYAIVQLSRHQARSYDLESTTASQAYGGAAATLKSRSAVEATRGLVLTWQGKVIPAYYSSSTGGTGQDAAIAIRNAPDIPPLRGAFHGTDSAASPNFRWGPIRRDRADLSRRLAGWGKANHHAIANLRTLRAIAITASNSVSRPTQFTVTDTSGTRYVLGPEEFRFACNFEGAGLPALPEAAKLRSSYVEVQVKGDVVEFPLGRGYGHGVGLCQWGAQGLALRGHKAAAILAAYYPGATLERAY